LVSSYFAFCIISLAATRTDSLPSLSHSSSRICVLVYLEGHYYRALSFSCLISQRGLRDSPKRNYGQSILTNSPFPLASFPSLSVSGIKTKGSKGCPFTSPAPLLLNLYFPDKQIELRLRSHFK
jgi:hypothetical protein